jgi:hypothetical protein
VVGKGNMPTAAATMLKMSNWGVFIVFLTEPFHESMANHRRYPRNDRESRGELTEFVSLRRLEATLRTQPPGHSGSQTRLPMGRARTATEQLTNEVAWFRLVRRGGLGVQHH